MLPNIPKTDACFFAQAFSRFVIIATFIHEMKHSPKCMYAVVVEPRFAFFAFFETTLKGVIEIRALNA